MLRSNPDKIREWQLRSRSNLKRNKRVNHQKPRRTLEEMSYALSRTQFIAAHPVCPVSGRKTCQVHHSAKREGRWLLLQRYWIAVSSEGHQWIEDNKREAEKLGLMVRLNMTADEHIRSLQGSGINLFHPVFYEIWDGVPFNISTEGI